MRRRTRPRNSLGTTRARRPPVPIPRLGAAVASRRPKGEANRRGVEDPRAYQKEGKGRILPRRRLRLQLRRRLPVLCLCPARPQRRSRVRGAKVAGPAARVEVGKEVRANPAAGAARVVVAKAVPLRRKAARARAERPQPRRATQAALGADVGQASLQQARESLLLGAVLRVFPLYRRSRRRPPARPLPEHPRIDPPRHLLPAISSTSQSSLCSRSSSCNSSYGRNNSSSSRGSLLMPSP